MDLFNKKKLREVEIRLSNIENELFKLGFKARGLDLKIQDFATTAIIVMAIKDYLKIEIKKELEDDPNYPKPEPKKRVVYKAYKLKK